MQITAAHRPPHQYDAMPIANLCTSKRHLELCGPPEPSLRQVLSSLGIESTGEESRRRRRERREALSRGGSGIPGQTGAGRVSAP